MTAYDTTDYRGWQIESDDDGHATVWDSEGGEHWEVGSV